MDRLVSYYQILGLPPNSSFDEVKQAYRKLAKVWHPDRYINQPQQQQQAELEIKKINQAYSYIKSSQQDKNNLSNNSLKINNINSCQIHYQQGVQYAEAEQYQQAVTEFSHAIRLNNKYIEAYQYRAFILSKLGYEYRANVDFKTISRLKIEHNIDNNRNKNHDRSKQDKQNNKFNQWQCIRTIIAHKNIINTIDISFNSKWFASGSGDGTIKTWQLEPRQSLGQAINNCNIRNNDITCIQVVNSCRTVISCGRDKIIRFWSLERNKCVQTNTIGGLFNRTHIKPIIGIAISLDKQSLVSFSSEQIVKIWNINRNREIKEIKYQSAKITAIDISNDNRLFTICGLEPYLRIRNLKTGKIIRSFKCNSSISSVIFSPDCTMIAIGCFDLTIRLFDLMTGKEINILKGHLDRISSLRFNHDSTVLFSTSWDQTVKIWNVKTGQETVTLTGHKNKVLAMAINSQGNTLITGGADCKLKIWRLRM